MWKVAPQGVPSVVTWAWNVAKEGTRFVALTRIHTSPPACECFGLKNKHTPPAARPHPLSIPTQPGQTQLQGFLSDAQSDTEKRMRGGFDGQVAGRWLLERR